MAKVYGYFMISPTLSYFKLIDESQRDTPVQDGGCLFWVDDVFMAKHLEVLESLEYMVDWVLVEIAGTENTICPDPILHSVFNAAILSGKATHKERLEAAQTFRRFKSTYACQLMKFSEFQTTFQLRQFH